MPKTSQYFIRWNPAVESDTILLSLNLLKYGIDEAMMEQSTSYLITDKAERFVSLVLGGAALVRKKGICQYVPSQLAGRRWPARLMFENELLHKERG